jgi:ABC-type sulfate transport system permease component
MDIRIQDYVAQDHVQWQVPVSAMLNLPVLLPETRVGLLLVCLVILYIIMATAEALSEVC